MENKLLHALVDELPSGGTWTSTERARFLAAVAANLDYLIGLIPVIPGVEEDLAYRQAVLKMQGFQMDGKSDAYGEAVMPGAMRHAVLTVGDRPLAPAEPGAGKLSPPMRPDGIDREIASVFPSARGAAGSMVATIVDESDAFVDLDPIDRERVLFGLAPSMPVTPLSDAEPVAVATDAGGGSVAISDRPFRAVRLSAYS